MHLYEEYFLRHKINDVPLIHHKSKTCIFFKCRELKFWTDVLSSSSSSTASIIPTSGLFEIKWNHNDHHPGSYEATIFYQLPDGHMKDQVFGSYHISTVRWNEYESFIFHFTKKFANVEIARSMDDAFVLGWEMFVASYDSWLNKQGGDLKYLLFQSLDNENPTSVRIEYISELLRRFSNNYPGITRNWKFDVLNKVQNHANWLVEIIDKHGKALLPS